MAGNNPPEPLAGPDALMLAIRAEPNGDLVCLYDDALQLNSIGDLDVRRASQIEFDPAAAPGGAWVAEDLLTRECIAVAAQRSECIRKEIAHYNHRFLSGYRPSF